ncbi:phosphate ABC transporter permease subunit PstC [Sulfurovum sp. ST-21]|uniref:Phosphate transport system permease protein n=1 Tax=Sulfurovum indicum TaxID=2779528 RepID=A0A7M1S405_9BACT|nr:phosphate ABC transporter permease subunit PstC [Sulfurovum indicum]QOR62088.1 phosphate ABC transporter permease subunit PstC [Sulfurovum indicum]
MSGKLFRNFSFISATLSFFLLVGIFAVLFSYAQEALHTFGFDFLWNEQWEPDEDDEGGVFGGYIPIVGTLLSTVLAMVLATPLAMGIAIFLTEIASEKVAKPVSVAIELLAAIPSIIYGMWGLFYFAPIVQAVFGGNGVGLLTAGIVLAIMIIPFMAAITRDSMNTTPAVLKESAYAMGATKFEVIKDVVMPYAKGGIIGSIILALGRALGETMAVAFLIGSVMSTVGKVTDPTTSIPVLLANNFAEAEDLEMSSMYFLALILFAISFAVISFAKFYFLGRKAK